VKRALISVSDKKGVVELGMRLQAMGYEILSTGGTYKVLKEAGVKAIEVSEATGFPECFDGRVKTLHPAIHGGILARRDSEKHQREAMRQGIEMIDLVAVNLYPFRQTVQKAGATLEEIIENIDIGGPTMLRSAAKNHQDVIVLCDPEDYESALEPLERGEAISLEDRAKLALKVFEHTAHYDAMIASFLSKTFTPGDIGRTLTLPFDLAQPLRYGENPHQKAWFFKDALPATGSASSFVQLHGKELSFNNLNDLDAAVRLVREFDQPAAVAVKHTNPCGVGVGHDLMTAYTKAHDADPVSIFGGIVALNRKVDRETAVEMGKIFLEIIVAPAFSDEALAILETKKNLRLLVVPTEASYSDLYDLKRIEGGLLVQEVDREPEDVKFKVVTDRIPTEDELKDLAFAWKICKHVKSNAIVVARGGTTLGVGPGQTSRVSAVKIALAQAGSDTKGAILASDAFFPFADSVEAAAAEGISAIIQPGGSVNDSDVIDACNRFGIAMVLTGVRHFKH
jgi:phosphoribosylaminoimidazolecarboxamide formyltransferase/IMP cyclohydrolase